MGLFSFRKKETESVTRKRGGRTRSSRTSAASEYSDHEQLDPLLPEKQRARRRLVGALALVLAAVIILPMILAPEPKPDTSNIALQIPSKNAQLPPVQAKDNTAQTLDNGEQEVMAPGQNTGSSAKTAVTTAPAVVSVAPAAPVSPVAQANAVPSAVPAPAAKTDNAVAAVTALGHAESAKETAKAPVKQAEADKKADKGHDNSAAKPAEKSKAEARANTSSASSTLSAGKGHFVIRIGAFSDSSRAKNWLVKLTLADVPSYIEPKKMSDGRTLYLLRSGPFNSRASAEAASKRVRQLGLTAQIAEVS